jgi:hypothetical protein
MLVCKKWALSHILAFRSGHNVTIRYTPYRRGRIFFLRDGQGVAFVTVQNLSSKTEVLFLLRR